MADRDRSERKARTSSMGSSYDDPPNSRLFIIGSKLLTEDDFRNAFEEFGNIEEIWMVKDRQTGENKGVTYVKYSRTSEAARALEAMNGKPIGNLNRSIRVMIAASRDQGSKRESNEEEKTQRLFVMVPKTMTDTELYNHFKVYGDIDYATIIRDRETKDSKGFGYVKYCKFSHAAEAFEQCDKKFKAVFAEPRRSRNDDKYYGGSGGGGGGNHSNASTSYDDSFNARSVSLSMGGGVGPSDMHANKSYTKLIAIVSPVVNQDQLWRLFDIVPGLDYCQLRLEGRPRPVRGIASIVYTSPQWAVHAKEKLHGFEYPPGNRIIIKPDLDSITYGGNMTPANVNNSRSMSTDGNRKPDILQIAETIAQASNLIQAAGLSPAKFGLASSRQQSDDSFCSVPLPEHQPLANVDDETAARCFIVCSPNALSNSVLKDVFCRFGSLIDVYMLNNRNCGYAKYADQESAENAIKVLHGAEICGVRLKVLKADEPPEHHRKRQRLDV